MPEQRRGDSAAPLLVSTAVVDITPEREVVLGCCSMDGPEWKIESRPEINLVALWHAASTADGAGQPVVLVSIDALYPGAEIRAALEAALPGVPPENIVLGATHTHQAPMTDYTKPKLGTPAPEHMRLITHSLAAAAERLLAPENRRPASLEATKGKGRFGVNRRYLRRIYWGMPPRFNVLRVAPHRTGPRDDTITVLRVVSSEGEPLALLWNYACHPVDFKRPRVLSTHFPGVVRDSLRAEMGEQLPVLFFQGFSGDIRPRPTAEPLIPRGTAYQIYCRVRYGPRFVPMGEDAYRKWAERISARVRSLAGKTRPIPVDGFAGSRTEVARERFVSPDGAPVAFQALTIGSDFGLVAVGGELVTAYAAQTRSGLRRRYTFCIGCADDVFGYAPTRKMLGQGGYEDTRHLPSFDLEGLNPDIERNMRDGIATVTARALAAGSNSAGSEQL